MIITCNNCNKKFDIDSNLISDNGRLLQCSSCNYKWFFQKDIVNKSITTARINDTKNKAELVKVNEPTEQIEAVEIDSTESIELLDNVTKNDPVIEKDPTNEENFKNIDKSLKNNLVKNKKNYKILSLIIIFITSFIALIIILDTFQNPISKFFPNIEFLLYNLYETINDIVLFISDLI